ncbi:MAG: haloacid dehalogenase type II [Myxococcales bacterium]|nr:MAG: haloacid dehalogenase type II [Myxococcales bacterium]
MARVLVFDVNETLLDLRVLDPVFERAFGDASIRRQWFGLVLRNAMALTITGDYEDFIAVGAASVEMVARQHGVTLGETERRSIRETMGNLPPNGDVLVNLQRLHDAGFRMAALTNSPLDAAKRQLGNAGIAPLLDEIMSVEATGKFKPAREPYEHAAATLGVTTAEMRMVAAHDWDIAGAMRAGCAGAYLLRPGMVLNPLYPAPDIAEVDLNRLAERIVEVEMENAPARRS